MSFSLHIAAPAYHALLTHLLRGADEEAAFGFATVTPEQHGLRVERIEAVPPEGFAFQSPAHIEVSTEYLGEMIKAAWDTNTALVEFHSHPGQAGFWRGRELKAEFSPSDLTGFEEWVPRVMWRLRHRHPYIAVVVAPDSFDALLWMPGDPVDEPRPIEALVLSDGMSLPPTGRTLSTLRAFRRTM